VSPQACKKACGLDAHYSAHIARGCSAAPPRLPNARTHSRTDQSAAARFALHCLRSYCVPLGVLQVGRLTAEAEAARAREARLRVDCDTLVARHHSALGELERVMAARTLARTAAHSAVDQVSCAQLAGGSAAIL
jgi:hypothetical protein